MMGEKIKYHTHNFLQALDRIKVLKEIWVGDLSWGPFTNVRGIIDHRSVPLALEERIGLLGSK
jgi:hypothetical protein